MDQIFYVAENSDVLMMCYKIISHTFIYSNDAML